MFQRRVRRLRLRRIPLPLNLDITALSLVMY